jgi:hypothetical protein
LVSRYVNLYRCSDGHIFVAHWTELAWASAHFGTSHFLRCPIDHRWRMATQITQVGLTADQVAEALRHPF